MPNRSEFGGWSPAPRMRRDYGEDADEDIRAEGGYPRYRQPLDYGSPSTEPYWFRYGGGGYGGWGRGDAYGLRPPRYAERGSRGKYAGRGPKGYRRSDERIREEINDLLYIDPFIDASDIEVGVSQGIVTLRGVVEDRHQKRLSEEMAESVMGVEDVLNELKVRHGFLARVTGEKATKAK